MSSGLACFSGTARSLRWVVWRNHGRQTPNSMFIFERSFWTVAAGLGMALAFVAAAALILG